MRATHPRPALDGYREAVRELIRAGEAFGDVEDAIEEVTDLTGDQKAALWLFGFCLRDTGERELDACSRPAADPVARVVR